MRIANKYLLGGAGLILVLCHATAGAEVVVIVSAKSAAANLSAEQASDIFLGAVLPGGGPAVPVDQPEGSPLRDEFYSKTAGKSPAQVKAFWSKMIFTGKGRPPREGGDSAAVKKMVADSPNAIGYIDRSAVDASVKVVLTVR